MPQALGWVASCPFTTRTLVPVGLLNSQLELEFEFESELVERPTGTRGCARGPSVMRTGDKRENDEKCQYFRWPGLPYSRGRRVRQPRQDSGY